MNELKHPNIIESRNCWSDEDCIYIVQEFGALGDLADVAARFRFNCIPEAHVAQKVLAQE